MKLGLDYITQIRGGQESGQLVGDDDADTKQTPDAPRTSNGWIALQLTKLVALIAAGYHSQHNDDDTHKTITATGSITERGRTTPLGEWIPVSYLASNFTAPTGATWTVRTTDVKAFQYTLIGTTMIVSFVITASQLSVAAATYIQLLIPNHGFATRQQFGTFTYDDNGTSGTGTMSVTSTSGGALITLAKNILASSPWSVSSNLSLAGQMAFEVGDTV